MTTTSPSRGRTASPPFIFDYGRWKDIPTQPAFGRSVPAAAARVLSTAALMGAVGVPLCLLPLWSSNVRTSEVPLFAALPSVVATAFAGALTVRILGSRYPEPALAALVLMVASLLVVLHVPPQWDAFQLDWFAVAMPAYAGGVFLLPLFDPAVRRQGPAPSRGSVAAAALAVTLVLLISGVALSHGTACSLTFLRWVGGGGLLGSTALFGLALLMTAVRLVTWGAWCGALGWGIFFGTHVVFAITGWFLP